jgi:hypothetical protein
VSLLIALPVAYLFWFDIQSARSFLNYGDFLRYQSMAHSWAVQVPLFLVPLGGAVGIVLGSITGLLAGLTRRVPRLAPTIALGLLFFLASEPGRYVARRLMTQLGHIIRYYLVPWSVSSDQIAVTGMLFGAIAGAVIAGFSMYAARRGHNAGVRG